MTDFLLTTVRLGITACALVVTPWLFVRRLIPNRQPTDVAVYTCLLSLGLQAFALLALHMLTIPIRPLSLGCMHLTLLPLGIVLNATAPQDSGTSSERFTPLPVELWLSIGLFFLLILPVTHLAGIDTYKWQNTATTIRVDQQISWFIHPLSLLGFTPRSYPCLQPFLLATVQILSGLGVKGGFFIVSLFSGFLAAVGAFHLGQRIFTDKQKAFVFTFLYVLSPLFCRYNHWATGPGLLMALLPAFLYALVFERGIRRITSSVLIGILVATSHKSGVIGVIVLPILVTISVLMPTHRVVRMVLVFAACIAGILFAPGALLPGIAGRGVGVARFALTRFGVLLPLCLFGIYRTWPARRFLQVCVLGLIVWLPPAFHSRAYAALLALPFLAAPATFGISQLEDLLPFPRQITRRAILCLCLIGAVITIVHRSSTAAPNAVVIAANLLEQIDPTGPYQFTAPGLARRQIQAYVSGCPRMTLDATQDTRVHLAPPPSLLGHPETVTQNWTSYLRSIFEISELDIQWHGKTPKRYFVIIDGQGERSREAVCLAREGTVAIYGSPRP